MVEDRFEMQNQLELSDNPGIIQLRHDSGLLLNIPCTHGRDLPAVTEPMRAFWNGKSWALELAHIKNTVVHCRFCRSMWRFSWAEIMPYLHGELKARLEKYDTLKPANQSEEDHDTFQLS